MRSLLKYGKNYYSQAGEDGILEEIFKRLKIEKGVYVDVGSSDGITNSNTHYLRQKGWKGICFEVNTEKYNRLVKNTYDYKNTINLNDKISKHNLGSFLDLFNVDKNFDYLDIDIDSHDYYVWKNLSEYHPKVIQIEILERIPLGVRQIHDENNWLTSFTSMLELGIEKGYTLASYTGLNMIFIRKDLSNIIPKEERENPNVQIYFEGKELKEYRQWVNKRSNLNS